MKNEETKNQAFQMAAERCMTKIETLQLLEHICPEDRKVDLQFTLQCCREILELLPHLQKIQYNALCSSILSLTEIALEDQEMMKKIKVLLDVSLMAAMNKMDEQIEELNE